MRGDLKVFLENYPFNFIPGLPNSVIRSFNRKGRDMFSLKDFDAVGDGIADDTAPWQNALASLDGNLLYVPEGIYRTRDKISYNGRANILGVTGKSIIRPDAGTGTAFEIINGICPLGCGFTESIEGLTISGANDPTGTGLLLGTPADIATNVFLRKVEVNGFIGAGGKNWHFQNATRIGCYSCSALLGETGLLFDSATSGVPTDISWSGGMVMFNELAGIDIRQGRLLDFFGATEIESNHNRAIWIHPPVNGQCLRISFKNSWIENNQTLNPGAYEIDIDGSALGSQTDIEIIHPYHVSSLLGSLFLQANDVDCLRLDELYLASGLAGNLRLGGAASRFVIENWNDIPNGAIDSGAIIYFNGATQAGNISGHVMNPGAYDIFAETSIHGALHSNNHFPQVNDMYYLGKNSSVAPTAWKGLVLVDQATGNIYRLEISGGAVNLVLL